MNASAGDILRGMQLEVHALRVGRPRAGPVVPASPELTPRTPEEDRLQLQELQREARERGYQEGLRLGLADARKQAGVAAEKAAQEAAGVLREQQQRLVSVATSLTELKTEFLCAAEDDMVALCFEAICQLVGPSAVQPDTVRLLLRSRAEHLAADAHADATLHVHPDDAALLRDETAAGPVRVVEDPDVALGGCIVRQPGGGIDARLETMLAACKEVLLAARARRRVEGQT